MKEVLTVQTQFNTMQLLSALRYAHKLAD